MENHCSTPPMLWDFEDEFCGPDMPPMDKPCCPPPPPCHHHHHPAPKPDCPHHHCKTDVTITKDDNVYTVKEHGLMVGQIVVPDYDEQIQTLINKVSSLEAEIEQLKSPLVRLR